MQFGSSTAYSTEKTYVYWAKRFVLYHNKRHPLDMGEKEISEFHTYRAVEENVAAPQGREDHDGLQSRPQPGRPGRSQPFGFQQLPGIDLATHSYRHIVLNWQRKRVRMWRCDSPISLSEATPVQSTQLDGRIVVGSTDSGT